MVSRPERLKSRKDFLAAAKGVRRHERWFVLQAVLRPERADLPPRFGFTATKKTGDAVERNRLRRRLREAVRLHARESARPGVDYVIVARREALSAPFLELARALRRAVSRAQAPQGASAPRPAAPPARERCQASTS